MEDERSALHSQRPRRPPPCLSTCTSSPPLLLSSFILHSLHLLCRLSLLASPSLSSHLLPPIPPPHHLSSSFLSHFTLFLISFTHYPSANFLSMVSNLSQTADFDTRKAKLRNLTPSEPQLSCLFLFILIYLMVLNIH